MKKHLVRVIAIILFLVLVYGVGVYMRYPNKTTPVGIALESERAEEDVLSKEEAKEDFLHLCLRVEKIHPSFLINDSKSFEEVKEELLKKFDREMTVGELKVLTERLLASLEDCNTGIGMIEEEKADFSFAVTDDEMRLTVSTALDASAIPLVKDAVKNGAKKLIVDVRGASGEDLSPYFSVLQEIGAVSGRFGQYVRYSKEAKQQIGYWKKNGTVLVEPNNDTTSKGLELEVITDEETKNAANRFAVVVSDGKIGTVLGTPKQSPSHYAGGVYVQLPSSKIIVHVSHLRMLRPDRTLEGESSIR